MFLGYNTNGFAHHRLADAVTILAKLGYRGIGLTLDVHHLDPFATDASSQLDALHEQLQRHQLRVVIETGARFLLNPERKHQPTLLSVDLSERQIRFNFLRKCIEMAATLGADCVSFWSGTAPDDASPTTHMTRLVAECKRLSVEAASRNVRLAFEPEPGMFIDTMKMFAELHSRVNHPAFGLTIDIGHLVCNGEHPVSQYLTEWKQILWNVHIEDMKPGVHDHILFGEGEVDFEDVFAGLREANYQHGVYIELSRHSHDAVTTARKSKLFLEQFMESSP